MAMPAPNDVISSILEDAMLKPSPIDIANNASRRKRELESEEDTTDDLASYPLINVPQGCHSSESNQC